MKPLRPIEVIQQLFEDGTDRIVPGPVFNVTEAVEDGKVWVWQNGKTIAGPFDTMEAGMAWVRASRRPDFPPRTPKHTPTRRRSPSVA